ncbi:hypothetical protein JCM10450v2_000133 [Rhodotorula kratochvilovae]
MPVPPLPNELVVLILEHLWTSGAVYSHERARYEPIAPARLYQPLLLVSRTWHRLALPFFVRRLDLRDLNAFVNTFQRYGVAGEVQAYHGRVPRRKEQRVFEAIMPSLVELDLDCGGCDSASLHITCGLVRRKGPGDPHLRHIRLSNLDHPRRDLRGLLFPFLLIPSAANLRTLDFDALGADVPADIKPSSHIFRNTVFPNLVDLRFFCPGVCCGEEDFFRRFPRVRSASIFLARAPPLVALPRLPPSLVSLEFKHCWTDVPAALAMVREQPGRALRVLSLFGMFNIYGPAMEYYKEILTAIREICDEHGIALTGDAVELLDADADYASTGEGASSNGGSSDGASSLGEDSSDDELDLEAEDDPRFLQLWSEEKQRRYKLEESLNRLRPLLARPGEPFDDEALRETLRESLEQFM